MYDPVQEHALDHAIRHDEWPIARFLAHHLRGILPRHITPLDLLFLVSLVCTRLGLARLWDTHAGAKLLCEAFDLLLTTADARQKKCLLSWGDPKHRRAFSQRDFLQPSITAEDLPRSAYELEERLFQEALVAAHLLRGARRSARRQQGQWQLYQQAAAVVFTRLLEVWLKLRKETSDWIAYACLRHALKRVWQALFGQAAPVPACIDEQDLPLWIEVEAFQVMTDMAKRGHTRAPAALARVVAEWQRGNLPPPAPPQSQPWPERHTVRFKV
jgi:hypothetical protein